MPVRKIAAAFPVFFHGPDMCADDGSEWQEAKPKRSHQRKEQQQQHEEPKQGPSTLQKPQQGLNRQSISSSGHDRPPAAASAAQQGDPITASLKRPKPEPSSRDCAKCGSAAHRYADALYLPGTVASSASHVLHCLFCVQLRLQAAAAHCMSSLVRTLAEHLTQSAINLLSSLTRTLYYTACQWHGNVMFVGIRPHRVQLDPHIS